MESGSKEKIAKSAGRVSGATLISRVLGLARDSFFAAIFGTTIYADAFNQDPEFYSFTRSLRGIAIPAGFTWVRVRAHDLVHGEGGREVTLSVPGR